MYIGSFVYAALQLGGITVHFINHLRDCIVVDYTDPTLADYVMNEAIIEHATDLKLTFNQFGCEPCDEAFSVFVDNLKSNFITLT